MNSAITTEKELAADTISTGPAPVTPTDRLAPSRAHHLLPPSLQGYFEASGWGASSFLESTKDFYDLYNLHDWRSSLCHVIKIPKTLSCASWCHCLIGMETENAQVSRRAYGFCSDPDYAVFLSCLHDRILNSILSCSGLSQLLFLRRPCIPRRSEVLRNFQTVMISPKFLYSWSSRRGAEP